MEEEHMHARFSLRLTIPLLYLSLILNPTLGFAEEEKRIFTLQESIAEAIAKNWTLSAKGERIEQATLVKQQARTEFLPKFSTTYGYLRRDDELTFKSGLGGDIPITSLQSFQSRTSVRQPVFTGFALLSSFELAKLGIDQSKMDFELEKLDLALRVKEAYFNILIADKGVEVAEKDVEFRKSNLKVARSFYDVGMIPINDVLRAEVELADSQQALVSARNTARLARSTFNTVLSRPINADVDVEDILTYTPERVDFDAYVEEALENRPEIKLININILQAEQDTRLAKSQYYPEVAVTWEYIREGEDPDVSGDDFHQEPRWEATAGLSWTFWEWGKTRYTVKEKESFKRELMQLKLALEESIQLETKDAVLRLENAAENIPSTEKAVEQAEENLRVNEERYKAQVTTITEVLDAQTLLSRARVNYFRALYNHQLAKASLKRALGTY
jgi:outer membrane protein